MTGAPHIPVLLDEVIAALAPAPGAVIVDATFGAGGYTRRLLDAGACVHAFDRDPDAIRGGRGWSEAGESPPRLVLHPRRFSEMVATLAEAGVAASRPRTTRAGMVTRRMAGFSKEVTQWNLCKGRT